MAATQAQPKRRMIWRDGGIRRIFDLFLLLILLVLLLLFLILIFILILICLLTGGLRLPVRLGLRAKQFPLEASARVC